MTDSDAISIARDILQKPERTNVTTHVVIVTCAAMLVLVSFFVGVEVAARNADMLHYTTKHLCK